MSSKYSHVEEPPENVNNSTTSTSNNLSAAASSTPSSGMTPTSPKKRNYHHHTTSSLSPTSMEEKRTSFELSRSTTIFLPSIDVGHLDAEKLHSKHKKLKRNRRIALFKAPGFLSSSSEQDRQKAHNPLTAREKIVRYLATSGWKARLEWLMVIVTILFCFIYVIGTYFPYTPIWVRVFEYLFLIFFFVDFLFRFYLAKAKWQFLFSIYTVIDILVFVPPIVQLFTDQDIILMYLGVLRLVRVLRVLKILNSYQTFKISGLGIYQEVYVLLLSVSFIIFISTSLIHLIEKDVYKHELPFHRAFYFVMITITTVGFGDFVPSGDLTRVTVIMMLVISIILLPYQTTKVLEAMSTYSGRLGFFWKRKRKHVIFCADNSRKLLVQFMLGFYHKDHGTNNTVTLVLADTPPSKGMMGVISNPVYEGKVKYARASIMDEDDLLTIRLPEANACFLFSNKSNVSSIANANATNGISPIDLEEDTKIAMKVASVKSFSPQVPVYAQIIHPTNKVHSFGAGADYVVCIEEIKMKLLAANTMCNGIMTLIANLIEVHKMMDLQRRLGIHAEWLNEYTHGSAQQIYKINIPDCLEGYSFTEASFIMYALFGVTLIGIIKEDEIADEYDKFWLHPGRSYFLTEKETGVIIAASGKMAWNAQTQVAEYEKFFEENHMMGTGNKETNDEESMTGASSDDNLALGTAVPTNSHASHATSSPMLSVASVAATVASAASINTSALLIPTAIAAATTPSSPLLGSFSAAQQTNSSPDFLSVLSQIGEIVKPSKSIDVEAFLQEHFEFTSQSRSLQESAIKDVSQHNIRDHVVITGPLTPSICDLVLPLRAKKVQKKLTIVFLNNSSPEDTNTAQVWKLISYFKDVYYMQGNSLQKNDLLNAGVTFASSVIVLASPIISSLLSSTAKSSNVTQIKDFGITTAGSQQEESSTEQYLPDSNAIFTFYQLQKLCPPTTFVQLELLNHSNARYLACSESLIPRTFASSAKLAASRKARFVPATYETHDGESLVVSPFYAAGNVYCPQVMDSLLYMLYYNSSLLAIVDQLLSGYNSMNSSVQRRLALFTRQGGNAGTKSPVNPLEIEKQLKKVTHVYQVDVPEEYHGKSYLELYHFLSLQQDRIPLGLYRGKDIFNNSHHYVFTNPAANAVVMKEDKVYVLIRERTKRKSEPKK